MKTRNSLTLLACIACLAVAQLPFAHGHGEPIELEVGIATNRLVINGQIEHGIFDVLGNTIITDEPGAGVSDPGNGVATGTEIGFVVTQSLLYWDGMSLAETSATLTVLPHDGLPYHVTSDTGLQTGMHWGTYDGTVLWDEHADYLLLPSTASSGVYGLAVQFVADNYGLSQSKILPLALGQWSETQVDDARALMQASLLPVSNPDFDNDGAIDATDYISWSAGFGSAALASHGQGDAVADGDVDGGDFIDWQMQFRGLPSALEYAFAVPEPATFPLLITCLLAQYPLPLLRTWTIGSASLCREPRTTRAKKIR